MGHISLLFLRTSGCRKPWVLVGTISRKPETFPSAFPPQLLAGFVVSFPNVTPFSLCGKSSIQSMWEFAVPEKN